MQWVWGKSLNISHESLRSQWDCKETCENRLLCSIELRKGGGRRKWGEKRRWEVGYKKKRGGEREKREILLWLAPWLFPKENEHVTSAIMQYLSFPFVSFCFLSFPFLSFPFFSSPFSNSIHLLFPQWQPRESWTTLISTPSLTFLQCSNPTPPPSPSPPRPPSE